MLTLSLVIATVIARLRTSGNGCDSKVTAGNGMAIITAVVDLGPRAS